MSTNSTISIENEDGSIKQVYCHWDGDVNGVGKMLKLHYTTVEKVNELITLGDISSLEKNIGTKHSFDNRPDNETTFFGRDRGEDGTRPVRFNNMDHFLHDGDVQQYNYMFRNGDWYLVVNNGRFVDYAIQLNILVDTASS